MSLLAYFTCACHYGAQWDIIKAGSWNFTKVDEPPRLAQKSVSSPGKFPHMTHSNKHRRVCELARSRKLRYIDQGLLTLPGIQRTQKTEILKRDALILWGQDGHSLQFLKCQDQHRSKVKKLKQMKQNPNKTVWSQPNYKVEIGQNLLEIYHR